MGITLSRQTMSNWLLRCAEDWLKPIYEALHKKLCAHEILHADETVLQVLHEPGKTAQSKSYIWIYRTSGDAKMPIVLYLQTARPQPRAALVEPCITRCINGSHWSATSWKNFLFANTPRGAKASAMIFSLLETAKEEGLSPYAYLTCVFKNAPNWNIH